MWMPDGINGERINDPGPRLADAFREIRHFILKAVQGNAIWLESCRTNCSTFHEGGCRTTKLALQSSPKGIRLGTLILRRANACRPSSEWSDDYDVLADGVVMMMSSCIHGGRTQSVTEGALCPSFCR